MMNYLQNNLLLIVPKRKDLFSTFNNLLITDTYIY